MITKKETEDQTGNSPRSAETTKDQWQQIAIDVRSHSRGLEKKIKSINNWLSAFTILLTAFGLIIAFLYCISIKQRTDILNLQDTLEEKNRIIKQYKLKNNE